MTARSSNRPARRPWDAALARFRRNRMAVFGLFVLIAFCFVALLAPVIAPADPAAQAAAEKYKPPSREHPLGTDRLGRDLFSRTVYGARVSLAVGVCAVLIASLLGLVLGSFSGYVGGWFDALAMRIVDGLLAFPRLLLVLTLLAFFANSVWVVITLLGATGWMSASRLVRGEVLRLKNSEFVHAAIATGASRRRIVLRHLIPNAIGPLIVTATLRIGTIVLLEAYLSFLGLGVQPPTPSWGAMVFDGRDVLLSAWWVSAFPGLAIVLTVVACKLVGDGLRDAVDVRTS
jgi:peptide/nickel transport system permease protein